MMLSNIPMMLTWLRIIIIPVFIALFYLPASWLTQNHILNWIAATLFVLASITDWLDGFLARRWKQTSDFGAFLDPVADKLIVSAALIILVAIGRTYAIFAIIIVGREITISALREWMAQLGKQNSVAVARIGKLKTATQMIAIILLLTYDIPSRGLNFIWLGNILMFIAVILTIWSMLYYLKTAIAALK